ncbi:MAG: hypothetical protein WBZ51_37540 [Xanthobacteraceae bacterium]|jgi:hypothetical protein
MGIFRRKVPHDYVPIHPDNIGTNNWIILLEAGTIVGSRTEKLRVAKAALEKKIKRKYNILLQKKHFLILEGFDPRIHAVYFCPQLYKYDGDNALIPLTGEEIGQLVVQSVQKGVVEKQPWYEALDELPNKPILDPKRSAAARVLQLTYQQPIETSKEAEGHSETATDGQPTHVPSQLEVGIDDNSISPQSPHPFPRSRRRSS